MKRLMERVIARVSLVGLLCASGCAGLIGADFDKELAPDEGSAVGGQSSGGGSTSWNTGGDTTSGGTSSGGDAGVGGSGAATGGSGSGTGGNANGGTGGVASTGGSGGASTGGSGGDVSTGGTGGAFNQVSDLSINEVCGHAEQFIELYNRNGSFDFPLKGVVITRTDTGSPFYSFPDNAVLGAGERMLLKYQMGFSFTIDAAEKFYLRDESGTLVSEFAYPGDDEVSAGKSYGRVPDGSSTLKPLDAPSPGEPNYTP